MRTGCQQCVTSDFEAVPRAPSQSDDSLSDIVVVKVQVMLVGQAPGPGLMPGKEELPPDVKTCWSKWSSSHSDAALLDAVKLPLLHITAADFPVEPTANANDMPLHVVMTAGAAVAVAAATRETVADATPSASCPDTPSPASLAGLEEPGDSFIIRTAEKRLAPAARPFRSLPASPSAGGFLTHSTLPRLRSEPAMTAGSAGQPGGRMTDLQRLCLIVQLAVGGRPLDEAMRNLRARGSALWNKQQQPSELTPALHMMTDLQKMAFVVRAATGVRLLRA